MDKAQTATPLPFEARVTLLIEAVIAHDEESWDIYDEGITDSSILDLVQAWSTGQCDEGCTSDGCCDYQRLDERVWKWIEIYPTGTVNGR
jgi:hypothetical protein